MPYYKNEGCYWTENLQNEMYLGYSITKQSWKLRGSAILHFEIYMTSRENKELLVSLVSFVSFLVKARYLDAYAFPRFETTTALD